METKRFYLKNLVMTVFVFSTLIVLTGCPSDEKDDEILLSSSKQITAFSITSPSANGSINESAKTIVVDVPAGTDVTSLRTSITVSENASVNPGSGVATNFTNPVKYTVTAENGSAVAYTVTVNKLEEEKPVSRLVELTSPITTNTTLKDLDLPIDYFFEGTKLEVKNNATLTIEKGVTIQFRNKAGYLSIDDGATLKAIGSADKHIQFVGATTEKGSWTGIDINTVLSNELKYVDILNAGGGGNEYSAALYLGNGKVDVNNCLIDRSATNGITIVGRSGSHLGELRTFSKNTISNCDKAPILTSSYTGCYALRNISNDNTFTANTRAYMHISQSINTSIPADMTLPNLNGYPWYFQENLMIPADRNFTVEPGAVILMGSQAVINIPANSHFIAVGTKEAPITIKGFKDELGYWSEIFVDSETPGTKFDYCNISNAGSGGIDKGLITYYREAYLEIYNSNLSKSLANGIVCSFASTTFNVHYNCHLKHANVTFSDITESIFYVSGPDGDIKGYSTLPKMSGDSWWMHF